MADKVEQRMALSVGDIEALSHSWRLSVEASNKSPSTVYNHTSGLELFEGYLRSDGMPTEVMSITRDHIEAFQAWMLGEPSSAG